MREIFKLSIFISYHQGETSCIITLTIPKRNNHNTDEGALRSQPSLAVGIATAATYSSAAICAAPSVSTAPPFFAPSTSSLPPSAVTVPFPWT
jgi:hypothetical protein